MNDVLFTVALALAWFGSVNLALSALAAAAAFLTERSILGAVAGAKPAWLLGLKLLPGAAALAFTLVVFLPAHWRFEPEGADESLGYTLAVFAALGAATIGSALRRAVREARITRALGRQWQARATTHPDSERALPVYRLPDALPIISLLGVRRPRVFVARTVLDAFSRDELAVSLAHERAHRDARDNLKRVLVACSPDALALWPAGRRLERRWRVAVEFAADGRAVNGSDARAVSLASALLKVARLSPGVPAPGSGLYDGALLSARIDRLLAPAHPVTSPSTPLSWRWQLSIAGTSVCAAAAAAEGVWLAVHLATEGLVRLLP